MRGRWHKFVIDKHGPENILIGTIPCSTDAISVELEIGLIKCFRRMGVSLTNMTDGGDGISGYKFTPEQRETLSEAQRKAQGTPKRREESRQQMLASNPMSDPIVRERYLQSMKRVHKNAERNEKIRQATMGNQRTAGFRWINNTTTEKLVPAEQVQMYLAGGYKLGRKSN
jgi:hypothetical protein